jgi:hypothetical protein
VGATSSDQGAAARSEHQRIVDFWTAERRAEARPADILLPGPKAKPDGVGNGKPGGGGGGDDGGTTGTVTGAKWTQGGNVAKTTGKVYFRDGPYLYVCSGSAVGSSSESLVLTAGHCVHDGNNGAFHTDWIFYPGYNNGAKPFGEWTATDLFTTSHWATTRYGFNDDAGFAAVEQEGSGSLESRLSGTAIPTIAFTQDSNVTYAAFGYPAAQKYKGQELIWCQGPVSETLDGYDSLAMACDMTGGSSGGPWFRDFGNGTPKINSLNSYGYTSFKGYMFGPIFGSGEQTAFNGATGGDCSGSPTGYRCIDYNP